MITIKEITDILDNNDWPFPWEYEIITMDNYVFLPFGCAEYIEVKLFAELFNGKSVWINLIDGNIIIKPK